MEMMIAKRPLSTENLPLNRRQLFDTMSPEGDELGQLVFGERGFFARTLDFDELAGAGHDEGHVDRGGGVFGVVEVEQGLALDQADANGGDAAG